MASGLQSPICERRELPWSPAPMVKRSKRSALPKPLATTSTPGLFSISGTDCVLVCVLVTPGVGCSYTAGTPAVELIAYYRVSTARQGESGLGLEAQRAKVQQMAAERGATVVAEFTEVESGCGRPT